MHTVWPAGGCEQLLAGQTAIERLHAIRTGSAEDGVQIPAYAVTAQAQEQRAAAILADQGIPNPEYEHAAAPAEPDTDVDYDSDVADPFSRRDQVRKRVCSIFLCRRPPLYVISHLSLGGVQDAGEADGLPSLPAPSASSTAGVLEHVSGARIRSFQGFLSKLRTTVDVRDAAANKLIGEADRSDKLAGKRFVLDDEEVKYAELHEITMPGAFTDSQRVAYERLQVLGACRNACAVFGSTVSSVYSTSCLG
jgi:hypothetical protein